MVKEPSWSASKVLEGGVVLLRPDQQVFEAMLQGWRRQQVARNLNFATVDARQDLVRRFQAFTNEYPWSWTPGAVDEWMEELRCVRKASRSTVRGYQGMLRAFFGLCLRSRLRLGRGVLGTLRHPSGPGLSCW